MTIQEKLHEAREMLGYVMTERTKMITALGIAEKALFAFTDPACNSKDSCNCPNCKAIRAVREALAHTCLN